MKTFLLAIVVLCGLSMGSASACTNLPNDTLQTYIVSAVMTKNGEIATIRLMHSLVRERTESEALQAFVKTAIKEYPGYKMASVLATLEGPQACPKSGAAMSA